MTDENYLCDGRIDKASFDVVISDPDVHGPVGKASLDQAFNQIGHKAVAVPSLSTHLANYRRNIYLLLCTPITARPNVLESRSIFFCNPAWLWLPVSFSTMETSGLVVPSGTAIDKQPALASMLIRRCNRIIIHYGVCNPRPPHWP